MKYSDEETRRFRPEDVEQARQEAERQARQEAEDRRAYAEYEAAEERRRQCQARERQERVRRNEARRRANAREEARRKKAEKAKRKQRDLLLEEAAEGTTLTGKLYITPRQRLTILRWSLCALVFFLVVVVQDVIFSRITVLDCVINFIPATILLISLTASVESGAVFALCASLFWSFSGAVLGSVSIFALTLSSVFLGALRESCFPKNIMSVLICCLLGLLAHELLLFLLALFLGYTTWTYWYQIFITTVFSVLICPVLYPLIRVIGRIGGNQWND